MPDELPELSKLPVASMKYVPAASMLGPGFPDRAGEGKTGTRRSHWPLGPCLVPVQARVTGRAVRRAVDDTHGLGRALGGVATMDHAVGVGNGRDGRTRSTETADDHHSEDESHEEAALVAQVETLEDIHAGDPLGLLRAPGVPPRVSMSARRAGDQGYRLWSSVGRDKGREPKPRPLS